MSFIVIIITIFSTSYTSRRYKGETSSRMKMFQRVGDKEKYCLEGRRRIGSVRKMDVINKNGRQKLGITEIVVKLKFLSTRGEKDLKGEVFWVCVCLYSYT